MRIRLPIAAVIWCLPLEGQATGSRPASDPVPDAEAVTRVRADLDREGGSRLEFRVHAATELLISSDPNKQRRGGQYLLALLAEDLARRGKEQKQDEDDGVAPAVLASLKAAPLFGGAEHAAPAAVWLWRHARDGAHRAEAAALLAATRAPAVDRVLEEIVAQRHPTHWALSYALDEGRSRGLALDRDAVVELCTHCVPGVRLRALALAREKGWVDPAAEPEPRPSRRCLEALAATARLAGEVPKDAPWVEATVPGALPVAGWLLRRGGPAIRWQVLTAAGYAVEFDAPAERVAETPFADAAAKLVADLARYKELEGQAERAELRARYGAIEPDHPRRDWTGSSAEPLMAAWARQRGELATAAKILQPNLEAHFDEVEALAVLRGAVLASLDREMVEAFVESRDLPRALGLARRLADPALSECEHYRRAADLADQLPRFVEETRTLALPAAGAWKALQARLSRTEQIAYLVARLRLSSRSPYDAYHADDDALLEALLKSLLEAPPSPSPAALRAEPAAAAGRAIDPFTELVRLDLSTAELPALLPALESLDFAPSYGAESTEEVPFARQVCEPMRVAWLAGALCSLVAGEDVVDSTLARSAAEKEAVRQRVEAWCAGREPKRASQRIAEGMASAEGSDEVASWFDQLLQIDAAKACRALFELAKRRAELLPLAAKRLAALGRGEFVAEARAWLRSEDQALRFPAAVLLLRHRQELEPAFACVREVLAKQGEDAEAMLRAELEPAAVEALLACGHAGARELLVARLARGSDARPWLEVLLFRAGFAEAHAALAKWIADPMERVDDADIRRTLRAARFVELAWLWNDAQVLGLDEGASAAALAAAAARLQALLDEDWASIRAGKEPRIGRTVDQAPAQRWGSRRFRGFSQFFRDF